MTWVPETAPVTGIKPEEWQVGKKSIEFRFEPVGFEMLL